MSTTDKKLPPIAMEVKTLHPTKRLRILVEHAATNQRTETLQQAWVCDDGSIEWINVEKVYAT